MQFNFCTTLILSALSACPAVQFLLSLPQRFSDFSYSSCFENIKTSSRESRLFSDEKLLSTSRPDSVQPICTPFSTQLSLCAHRRPACGCTRASEPRTAFRASLSRYDKHPGLFNASPSFLDSCLISYPHQKINRFIRL